MFRDRCRSRPPTGTTDATANGATNATHICANVASLIGCVEMCIGGDYFPCDVLVLVAPLAVEARSFLPLALARPEVWLLDLCAGVYGETSLLTPPSKPSGGSRLDPQVGVKAEGKLPPPLHRELIWGFWPAQE